MFIRQLKTSIVSGSKHAVCFILFLIIFTIMCLKYTYYFNYYDIKPRAPSATLQLESNISNNNTEFWNRPEQLVIVVQVHVRDMYLKHLIDSLRAAAEIETVLLIFAHDYYDEKLNKLIATIDFCKYKQIFYPNTIQNYSNSVSGPAGMHDPEPKRIYTTTVQMKHFWWWKISAVFNSLSLQHYKGLVLLLEDDFYVLPDFIPTLRQMEVAAKKFCQNCKILSLAANFNALHIGRANVNYANLVKITNKFSNMGIAFNLTSWNDIAKCKDSFCKYNDANWDFSLQNVLSTCLQTADTMILMFPRIVHIGSCGVHIKSANCDPSPIISKIGKKLEEAKGKLFPKDLIENTRSHMTVFSRPNGGWTDIRDQELCSNLTTSIIEAI